MQTIRLGLFGLGRGTAFFDSIEACNGKVVAVCEKNPDKIAKVKERLGEDLAVYEDFDAFIEHDMDAVFLCNYFHEHAPYAIRALEKGIHVLSETTSNATMADGVALVRAAEKSNALYMLAENYPYMRFNKEMDRVYKGGTLGKALFAEGEYNHPVSINDKNFIRKHRPYDEHWRNTIPRSYYITHSLAPLMHITGASPVRVSALPVFHNDYIDSLLGLYTADVAAIITCLNDDKSVFRVTGCAAFGAHENSYRICGTKGQIENVRGGGGRVMLRYNAWNTPEGMSADNYYMPEWNDPDEELIQKAGHGGGDFLVIREFFSAIRENRKPAFDVYFATTMASVAILANRSIMNGGKPYDVPDFHKEEDRVLYENDRETPFYGSDGSKPTIGCCSDPDFKPDPAYIEQYHAILRGE